MSIIERVTAYVDESLRLGGEGRYVLAAVVVPAGRAADVRATLRSAVPRGMRRYHWRKESAASRTAMVATVTALGLRAVVVTAPLGGARPERARRRCLTRLLWELAQRGIPDVVFETRGAADAADRHLMRHVHRAGWAERVEYEFAHPDAEPLLWLPDVVAGAVARAVGDDDGTWLAALRDSVIVVALS